MKFIAEVKTDDGEWVKIDNVRWIALDENGKPERICGPSGLQYGEFRLGIDPTDKDKQAGAASLAFTVWDMGANIREGAE